MFDTENKFYNAHNHKIGITNCNGGIYKTYRESFFMKININDELMEKSSYYDTKNKAIILFEDATTVKKYVGYGFGTIDKKIELDTNRYKEFVILQMVIISKDYLMAEIILKEDFIRYFVGNVGVKEE